MARMTPAQRRAKHKYNAKPEQIRRRSNRNKARRKLEKEGKVRKGDGKDVGHSDSNPMNNDRKNLKVESQSHNRSFARNKDGSQKMKNGKEVKYKKKKRRKLQKF